jgi:hypothetical protein
METDPNRQLELLLRLARGVERPRRGLEGDEEGVALRIDLDPPCRSNASRSTRRWSASAIA